jgi:diguanylate cyclase (GGDEF)-like protein
MNIIKLYHRLFIYHKLKYLAYHDALTNLYNRNWLYENMDKIRFKYIYFIDINNLREVNKLGHTFGDNHIKSVVADILDSIDKKSILVRYAGDEFILFSNSVNEISSNNLYSVGQAKISNSVKEAINNADADMIQSKIKFKNLK